MAGVIRLNKKDDWETPPHIFQFACDHFGFIPQLDVCATEENSLCKYHYDHDGLFRPYDVDVWCNPPYSEMKKWVRKCYFEHIKNNVNIIMLIFAKTDTLAFHDYIFGKAEIYFLKGRLNFFDKGRESLNNAPYGSALICYRKKD